MVLAAVGQAAFPRWPAGPGGVTTWRAWPRLPTTGDLTRTNTGAWTQFWGSCVRAWKWPRWYSQGRRWVSLRSKETGEAGPSPGRWFAEAHPTGVRWESDDSSRSYLTLEATFRHRYFEHITHLYKHTEGSSVPRVCPQGVDVPFEGYWALPDWDRSEP